MELRDFRGSFVINGRETDVIDLRILISVGGGETHGSGAFRVPASLIGLEREGPLCFRTEMGDEITLEVREFDLTQGIAYFLTSGAVPDLRQDKQA